MCGIAAAVSPAANIVPVLRGGLRKLEYRGYDSAGIAVAPNDSLLDKLKSNLKEVQARGGELNIFAHANSHFPETEQIHVLLPEHYADLSPILHVVAQQVLAYYTALAKGTDVDMPRSLAKSVTVE